jgi:hypothetical protein
MGHHRVVRFSFTFSEAAESMLQCQKVVDEEAVNAELVTLQLFFSP